MIVGIFAEGRGDLAVLTNILKGWLDIDQSDLRYQLPEFEKDQTDLSIMPDEQQSSWTVIKKECQEREKIKKFFDSPIEQESFIVLHLDTAERNLEEYNVIDPIKNNAIEGIDYCTELRNNVINKINAWLENAFQDQLAYAVAIEETDAWVLTIYDKGNKDTSPYSNPKKKLDDTLNLVLSKKEKNVLKKKAFEKYDWLSSEFRRKKKLSAHMLKNESLKLFCESLDAFTQKGLISDAN